MTEEQTLNFVWGVTLKKSGSSSAASPKISDGAGDYGGGAGDTGGDVVDVVDGGMPTAVGRNYCCCLPLDEDPENDAVVCTCGLTVFSGEDSIDEVKEVDRTTGNTLSSVSWRRRTRRRFDYRTLRRGTPSRLHRRVARFLLRRFGDVVTRRCTRPTPGRREYGIVR